MYIYSKEEIKLIKLLEEINPDRVKNIIATYIKDKSLQPEYIELITELSKDYMAKSNSFITQIKRDANFFWQDEAFGKNILKNADIDEKNWFWYARLLRDTEDEEYPKSNYLLPTYILKRLKPIIKNLKPKELKKQMLDEELYNLYQVLLKLYDKYEIKLED